MSFNSVVIAIFLFKYFTLFIDIVCNTLRAFSIELYPITLEQLLLIGISFYIFYALSYVINVYRKRVRPNRNLGKYVALISFFN